MSRQCKEEVWSAGSYRPHRCLRKAVSDGFCNQHHPDSVEARREKSRVEYEEQTAKSPARQLVRVTQQRDELLAALKDLYAERCGQPKSCGHDYECICAGQKASQLIAKVEQS